MHLAMRLLPALILLFWIHSALARDLHLAEEDLVSVELATVAVVPGTNAPVVLLREPDSGATVPIFIGPTEARAILIAQRGVDMPRPMTHDLLSSVIDSLSGTLESVVVDALRDNTYHGALEIRIKADQSLVRVDSRPSDALALAARTGAHIRVAPEILIAGEGTEYESIGQDEEVVTALGITVSMVTEESREAMELPDEPGVLVLRAVGEAEEKGIGSGALILEVNGEVPTSALDFLELVQRTPVDEDATIRFWYEDEVQEVELDTHVPRQGMPPEEAGPQV